jgi:hypothetical protein
MVVLIYSLKISLNYIFNEALYNITCNLQMIIYTDRSPQKNTLHHSDSNASKFQISIPPLPNMPENREETKTTTLDTDSLKNSICCWAKDFGGQDTSTCPLR